MPTLADDVEYDGSCVAANFTAHHKHTIRTAPRAAVKAALPGLCGLCFDLVCGISRVSADSCHTIESQKPP